MKSNPTTVRLTPVGKSLLKKISERLGVSKSDAIEISIREKAQSLGMEIDIEVSD